MELTWVVLISVCCMLLIFACLVGISICICRRNQPNGGVINNGNIQSNNGNFNQIPREHFAIYFNELISNENCTLFSNDLSDKSERNEWFEALNIAT